jgi:hypothetical protein
MQLFEKKSFTRLTGYTAILVYSFCAIWAVVHGDPMPDIPPILAGTIALLYGINRAGNQNVKA